MIQVWRSFAASRIARRSLRAWARLSMNSAADSAASTITGRYTAATRRGWPAPVAARTASPTSWTAATPMLPPPALRPSAQPLCRCG